ncbi:hypothetical protein ScPMuIL_009447 [Solemya velum]
MLKWCKLTRERRNSGMSGALFTMSRVVQGRRERNKSPLHEHRRNTFRQEMLGCSHILRPIPEDQLLDSTHGDPSLVIQDGFGCASQKNVVNAGELTNKATNCPEADDKQRPTTIPVADDKHKV